MLQNLVPVLSCRALEPTISIGAHMNGFVVAAAALSSPAPRTSNNLLGRRALLAPVAAALTLPLGYPKAAQAEQSLTTYTDARYGVSFGLPDGWTAVERPEIELLEDSSHTALLSNAPCV